MVDKREVLADSSVGKLAGEGSDSPVAEPEEAILPGDWVFWSSYPMGNGLLRTSIVDWVEGDVVYLVGYNEPVPLTQLRRC